MKVGDTVEYVGEAWDYRKGRKAKVIETFSFDNEPMALVEFDKELSETSCYQRSLKVL